MSIYSFDVDVDTPSSFDPTKVFSNCVKASQYRDHKLMPHQCGVYFQDVPTDPVSGLAAVPYEEAERLGCFKIDFLHLSIYDHFTSKDEIKELLKHEPDWTLLQIPSVVEKLFQLAKHYDLIQKIKPKSIDDLADCLALIRPQKRFILQYYLNDRARYRRELYKMEDADGYAFKKAHAIAYALVVVLQLHLIKGGVL